MEVPKPPVVTSCKVQSGEPAPMLPYLAPQTFVEQEQLIQEAFQITHMREKYFLAEERRINV